MMFFRKFAGVEPSAPPPTSPPILSADVKPSHYGFSSERALAQYEKALAIASAARADGLAGLAFDLERYFPGMKEREENARKARRNDYERYVSNSEGAEAFARREWSFGAAQYLGKTFPAHARARRTTVQIPTPSGDSTHEAGQS